MRRLAFVWITSALLCCAAEAGADVLLLVPPKLHLSGPRSEARYVALLRRTDGSETDVTDAVATTAPAAVRTSGAGRLLPVSDGTGHLVVRYRSLSARVPVTVRGLHSGGARRVSFLNEVIPILTRHGCSMGACHGSQFGRGGFKLSLAGYDPDADWYAIVRSERGRRVLPTVPERSLLLAKPSLGVAHAGGLKLRPSHPDYRTLLQWLREGASGPEPDAAHPVSLSVYPSQIRREKGGLQRLVVQAVFSDGSVRDVTSHSRISSTADTVAECSPQGVVQTRKPGIGGAMARYGSLVAVADIAVPFGSPTRFAWNPAGFVDTMLAERWREMGLQPSRLCTDAEYIRRASMDLIGTQPTPAEIERFLADRSPDKRTRLVDSLLERPEYADWWALKWGDLLRISRTQLGERGMWQYRSWLHAAFVENRPFNWMVQQLLTASGRANEVGAANYFRTSTTPEELTETTAQLFLGVRLQCAKCHNHPFDRWTQRNYFQFAAFFARTKTLHPSREPLVLATPAGEARHPKTQTVLSPSPLPLPNTPTFAPVSKERRQDLALWIADDRNMASARTIVNRYWGYLFGRGLVHPIDDMRPTNPCAHKPLLDALSRGFIRSGWNLKWLLKTLAVSRAYQLSADTEDAQRSDASLFTRFTRRRIGAEALLDAINAATETTEKFAGMPGGTRAVQLPDATVPSMFLETFGRPPRAVSCECERVNEPDLRQALQLLNSEHLQAKIAAPTGRVARLIEKQTTPQSAVRELYLATIGRPPLQWEMQEAVSAVQNSGLRQGLEDLLWALLNHREFTNIR